MTLPTRSYHRIALAKWTVAPPLPPHPRRACPTARPASVCPAAQAETFERLRALRKRLADAEGVPAYIVFSDAVLREMAKHAPRTRAELLGIPGVGPVKLERYGEAFLKALREG